MFVPSGRPPELPRRVLQGVAGLCLAAIVGLVSTSGSSGCTPFCEGGFLRQTPGKAATCEGLCAPSKCENPGNVCVDNHCELQCTSLRDCTAQQDCVAATTDGKPGSAVTICKDNGKAPIGASCPFGSECATQMSCPDGSACGGSASPGCAMADCKPLTCLTNGSGDLNAYCTLQDCQGDSNCPGGYWCEQVRDPHPICGQPAPDPNLCGTTTDACVTLAQNTANGTTYAAGSVCTQRNECRVRQQCDPCRTDIDCSLVLGRHCTQVGSATDCTFDCSTDSDCHGGFQCTSGACVPRFGSCTGSGKFCEPCHDDAECASGLLCIAIETGGERFCFNPTIPCTTNGDCPKAPSGLQGVCATSGKCDPPVNTGTGRLGCWCGNKGVACYLNAECCSKNCKGPNQLGMVPGTCL